LHPGTCISIVEEYKLATGAYTSSEFNQQIQQNGVEIQSIPDMIELEYHNGIYCWHRNSPDSNMCSDYTNTFTFSPSTLGGYSMTWFWLSISPDYSIGGTITINTTTAVAPLLVQPLAQPYRCMIL
jgi:hypothetical protein